MATIKSSSLKAVRHAQSLKRLMDFPFYIHLFGIRIHPHLLFEMLAYSVGFQVYLRLRRRQTAAFVPLEASLWILLGCVFGALFGSKVLSWLETPHLYWEHRENWFFWLQGKTIVGGFIGGWLGVELVKKLVGVTHSTGDTYVFPLLIGAGIGRIGCFLSGREDDTYGIQTGLPWGVNFGDGILRHPTQLYEIGFLLVLGLCLWPCLSRSKPNGWLFRVFMAAYFGFRLLVEFIKPRPFTYGGLSAIQIASLAAALYCLWALRQLSLTPPTVEETPVHG